MFLPKKSLILFEYKNYTMSTRKLAILIFALAGAILTSSCVSNNCTDCGIDGKADKIVTGNIITMDSHKMHAEAMTIKNGKVQYVGTKEIAEALCDENTLREDYGEASVYPGFIDVHVHPQMAGQRKMESINLVGIKTVDGYLEKIAEFVKAHPEKKTYKGAGWSPRDREMLAKDLDKICADKPIVLNSIDGHSYWLNSKALEAFGFTREVAEEDGEAMVHVDAEGNPSGVVVEEAERLAQHSNADINEEKEVLLLWQDFAFSLGLTTVGDAGFSSPVDLDAYSQLEKEGKLKLLTYCSYYEPIPGQSVDEKLTNAINAREKYNGDFFKVSGIKMFVDGVVEGHTAWMIDDYCDQPGYTGVKKLDDHDYLVKLVSGANTNGLYVHLHTIGDGAVKFAVDAIEEAQKQTGIYNARNCMAHLQILRSEDIKRIADNNIVAIVAPLWTPYDNSVSPLETIYIGNERCENAYPIKSFLDYGGVIAFHSDYPVSSAVSIPGSISTAVQRCNPGFEARHPEKEGISRLQALEAMTTNAAYALGDNTIGSLESGKKANYVVFDADFLKDSFDDILASSAVATAVGGEIVYKR